MRSSSWLGEVGAAEDPPRESWEHRPLLVLALAVAVPCLAMMTGCGRTASAPARAVPAGGVESSSYDWLSDGKAAMTIALWSIRRRDAEGLELISTWLPDGCATAEPNLVFSTFGAFSAKAQAASSDPLVPVDLPREDLAAFSDMLQVLREKECSLEVRIGESRRRTVLWEAVARGHRGMTRILLEAGADPRAPDAEGIEPVVVAAQRGGVRMLKLLKEHGASLEARDRLGANLIGVAARRGTLGSELLEWLIEQGIDINETDGPGSSPLGAVEEQLSRAETPEKHQTYERIASLLREHGAEAKHAPPPKQGPGLIPADALGEP